MWNFSESFYLKKAEMEVGWRGGRQGLEFNIFL